MPREAEQYADTIRSLVPLNGLAPELQNQLVQQAEVRRFRRGDFVFRQGDRDGLVFYLIEGEITLYASEALVKRVLAGTDASRYALAQLQPRQYSARAETAVVVISVVQAQLDRLLAAGPERPTPREELRVSEIQTEASGDWMTRMLQSELFSRIPAVNLQRIFAAMEAMELKAGEVVVRQGDPGDYYYIIQQGRCEVTRRGAPDKPEVKLAELRDGDSFGEDALVGDTVRNATVTMARDGVLMRLTKRDFVDLIKKPTLVTVGYGEARRLAALGAVWLDVRFPDEQESFCIEDSVNIPLNALRLQASRLDRTKKYIVFCDTGSRSSVGAFLLTQRGLDACCLDGGYLKSIPPSEWRVRSPPGSGESATTPAAGAPPGGGSAAVATDARVAALEQQVWTARRQLEEARRGAAQAKEGQRTAEGEVAALRKEADAAAARLAELGSRLVREQNERQAELSRRAAEESRFQAEAAGALAEVRGRLERELADLRGEAQELLARAHAGRDETAAREAQLAEAQAAVEAGRAELARARESHQAELLETRSGFTGQVESLGRELSAQRQRAEAAENGLAAVRAELETLRLKADAAGAELARVRGSQAEVVAAAAKLERDLAQSHQALVVERERLGEASTRAAFAEARLAQVSHETQSQNAELERQLAGARAELDGIRARLAGDLAALREELKTEQGRAREAAHKLDVADARVAELEAGLAFARATLDQTRVAAATDLAGAASRWEEERGGLLQELEHERAKLPPLEGQVQALAGRLEQTGAQAAELRGELEALRTLSRAELDSLRNGWEQERTDLQRELEAERRRGQEAGLSVQSLEAQLADTRRQLDLAHEELEHLQIAAGASRDELHRQLERTLADLRVELDAEHRRSAALQAEGDALRQDLADLRAVAAGGKEQEDVDRAELVQRAEHLAAQGDALRRELADLREAAGSAAGLHQAERGELLQRAQRLEADLTRERQDAERELTRQVQALESLRSAHEREGDGWRVQAESLRSRLVELEGALTEARERRSASDERVAELSAAVEDQAGSKERQSALEARLAELGEDLDAARRAATEAEAQARQWREAAENARRGAAAHAERMIAEAREADQEALAAEREALQAERKTVEALSAEAQRMRQEAQELQRQMEREREALPPLDTRRKGAKPEGEEPADEVVMSRDQVEALRRQRDLLERARRQR